MARQKDEDINDAVAYKIRSAAHQELNNLGTMLRLKGRIKRNKDLFGRKTDFQVVEIDETFPEYIRSHLDEYAHLIKTEQS